MQTICFNIVILDTIRSKLYLRLKLFPLMSACCNRWILKFMCLFMWHLQTVDITFVLQTVAVKAVTWHYTLCNANTLIVFDPSFTLVSIATLSINYRPQKSPKDGWQKVQKRPTRNSISPGWFRWWKLPLQWWWKKVGQRPRPTKKAPELLQSFQRSLYCVHSVGNFRRTC